MLAISFLRKRRFSIKALLNVMIECNAYTCSVHLQMFFFFDICNVSLLVQWHTKYIVACKMHSIAKTLIKKVRAIGFMVCTCQLRQWKCPHAHQQKLSCAVAETSTGQKTLTVGMNAKVGSLEVHQYRLVEHDIQTVLLIQKSILVIKLSSKYLKNIYPKPVRTVQ